MHPSSRGIRCPISQLDTQSIALSSPAMVNVIGIKHIFSRINVREDSKEMLKTEGEARGF